MQSSSLYLCVLAFSSMVLQGSIGSLLCEQDLQVVKEKRIGAIRNQILSKLGLTEAPTEPAPTLTPAMMETYYSIQAAFEREARSRSGCLDRSYFAKRVTVVNPMRTLATDPPTKSALQPSLPTPYYTGSAQTGQNLSFTIQLPSGSSNDIDYAELKLKKTCPESWTPKECYDRTNNLYATVELYLFLNTTFGTTRLFVTGRSLILNDGKRWEEFEITEAVQQCLTLEPLKTEFHLEIEIKLNPPENWQNYVEASVYNTDPYAFFQNDNEANLETDTQLIVFAVNERDAAEDSRRQKRQLTKDFCFGNFTTNCCVRNLTINFVEDLGWDWIAAPAEYDPNYCSGDCPYLWPSATLFAEVLQTLKLRNPTAAAEPCCVAETLLPLTIIRSVNGFPVFEPLSDMIVDSCICR